MTTSSEPSEMRMLVHRRVVLNVLLALLAGHLVERRLGDVEVAGPDQLRHVAAEEGQQQRPDVGAIDVGIGHDDDLVVAHLLEVEGSFLVAVSDPRPEGGDHRLDFLVLKRLVQAGLLDVDDLAPERQDRLGLAVAARISPSLPRSHPPRCRVRTSPDRAPSSRPACREGRPRRGPTCAPSRAPCAPPPGPGPHSRPCR